MTFELRSVLFLSLLPALKLSTTLKNNEKLTWANEAKLLVLTVKVKSGNISDSSENLENVERKKAKH